MPVGTVLARITAEGAETAVLDAVIADVEVAVHHIGDRLTRQGTAPLIGQITQRSRSRLSKQPQGQIKAGGTGGIGGQSRFQGTLLLAVPGRWGLNGW
jgi:hypothetical protein